MNDDTFNESQDSPGATPPERRTIARRLFKWTAITLGVVVALIAILLIAFQVAMSRVPEYRVQLQQWISGKTRLSVEFTKLNARLRFYGPELAFVDVTVRTPDRTRVLATARAGSVGFDLWHSIRSGRLTAARFTLESPQLGLIRTRDGRIQIAGQGALEETKPFAIENLPVGKFRVRDAVVSFQDEATGRGPWSMSGVRFDLWREPEMLELRGQAVLPTALGQTLQFSARIAGALESPENVVSTVTLEGEGLDLTGVADLFPDRWPAPESGRGSLKVTTSLIGSALQSAVIDTTFTEVTSSLPAWTLPLPTAAPLVIGGDHHPSDGHPAAVVPVPIEATPEATSSPTPRLSEMLSYARIHLSARVARDKDGWKAAIKALDLEAADRDDQSRTDGADWHSRAMELRWSTSPEGAFSATGQADVIVLKAITPLLAYLPESTGLARLRALELRGTVRNVAFDMSRRDSASPVRYTASAAVDDFGFNPVARAPGFTGISGTVQASDKGGEFKLDSGPIQLSLPYMFRWPLDTQAVRGVLGWRDEGDAWSLGSEHLEFEAEDGKGEAKLAIRIPRDGASPQLDISAQARDMKASATPKYLPANTLSPAALAWLDRAFVSGRVPRGSLELHGPTRSFPFRHGEGVFLVKGFVEDVTFDYQAGWTPATELTGNVEFRNEGMHASGITARVGDLRVTEASGGFKDFKEGDLKIAAAASGDLSAALTFLQASPIGEVLGEPFKALRGEGVTHSTVNLLLPITHVEDRRLAVATKLENATVSLADLEAPITQLNGSLIVRQSLPVEADLSGQFLGGPVNVAITPDDRTDTKATLAAHGRASAPQLARFLPSIVKVNGAMEWRLSTRLDSEARGRAQIYQIDSSLSGFGIDMPYPAGKAADIARPMHVELEQLSDQLVARAAYGDLRGLIRVQRSKGGWAFDRGGVRGDAIAASLPAHKGLRLEGSIDRVRLDDWFALQGGEAGKAAGKASAVTKLADFLHAANLHIGVLQLYGYEWPEVRGVMQATEQGWRVDVTGTNVEGQLVIPEDFKSDQPLTINLERLIVTPIEDEPHDAVAEQSDSDAKRDPREWPSLRVHVGDMHVENHPIGGVDIVTTRVADGMKIDSLTIDQDAVQAEAQGDWRIGPAGQRSSLTAKITSTDVRATLRALNYTEFLEAKRAEVSAQLTWPGGFDASLIKRASGTITVAADSGQLLTLQPGAGRVLGLFSVAALPRRLSLDFSDLTEKGLSFDTIHGDFELREGNAYTSNLLLRGPAAEIGVAGRTGLASQDYDQTAVVTGNLGASIPVAGALAGGPAVGAALLLFSQVFKEPLKGIARGYYRIKGTWNDPVVERVDASEAKESALQKPKVDG